MLVLARITHRAASPSASGCLVRHIQIVAHPEHHHRCDVLPFEKIPGPKRYAILGPINDALTMGSPSQLHKTIDDFHHKFGPIFRVQLAEVNAIFVSSSECMRAVFAYEGKYPRHPVPPAWLHFNEKFNCKRGLFFMEGEEWLTYRKILNPILLRNFNETHQRAIEMACDKLINAIDVSMTTTTSTTVNGTGNCLDKNGIRDSEFIELKELEMRLYRWSTDVILHVMLGHKTQIENIIPNEMLAKFASGVHEIFEKSADIAGLPPKLATVVRPKAWQAFEHAVQENLDLGNTIIDFVLGSKHEEGMIAELKKAKLSDNDIKRIFTDLIIAAGDTSASALRWTLYLLAKNSTEQQKFRDSLTKSWEDTSKNVIRESLRMYPTAHFIGRILDKDAVLGNYFVPKHTLALLSLYTAGRTESNFSNPNEFIPSRWEHCSRIGTTFCPQGSMPFAMGVRSCIGKKLAMYGMQYLISKIVERFELKLLNETDVGLLTKMVLVPGEEVRIALKRIIDK